MLDKIKDFLNKICLVFPIILTLIGVLYFINLFDRIKTRDLTRQSEEKYQIVNAIENLNELTEVLNALNIMDRFDDTNTYFLDEDLNRVPGKFHTKDCPFRYEGHPYEITELRDKIMTTNDGAFEFNSEHKRPILWEYRWIKNEGKKYLILVGVSNYPKQPIDNELQIAIGFLLLFTTILNLALVGVIKYVHVNARQFYREQENDRES